LPCASTLEVWNMRLSPGRTSTGKAGAEHIWVVSTQMDIDQDRRVEDLAPDATKWDLCSNPLSNKATSATALRQPGSFLDD
jgi:hypothetical protein